MTKRATAFVALLGIVLAAGLYILPDRTPPKVTLYDDLAEAAVEKMSDEGQAQYKALSKTLDKSSGESRQQAFNALALFWQAQDKPNLQAESLYQAAELSDADNEAWAEPGDLFFESIHATEDESEQMNYVFHAMYCYEKHLEANPDDLNRKVNLSECYTDHQGNIMQGVLLLREVAETDPSNTEAQMRLGRFSMMSGQTSKAIARFESALAGDSLNLQARILLAESKAGSGDLTGALSDLQEGLVLFSDSLDINELQSRIDQIETVLSRSGRPASR